MCLQGKSDCVFKGSQLPKWAKGSPQKFFSAATRYEDKGNRRYKEIELSLPNELALAQNRSIVDQFIANHLANHYYAYAIHEKAGELSNERHPHVHIMFSERLIDDVEKIQERPACKYFRRAAKPIKGEQVASFERRSQHGAPKDPKWHDKNYLYELREDFARIQNEVLTQNGFSIHVDCRTLKAQQETAEKDGDNFLAQLYKRMPESYVGILPVQEETENSRAVKRYRRNVQSKQHVLFQADLHQKMTEEFETKLLVRQAEYSTFALMNSQAYKSANLEDESLRNLNQEILAGLERIKEVKRYFVGVDRAIELAKGQYLTPADRKFILDYRNVQGQECNLEKLLKELTELPETYKESQAEFQEIKRVMEKKISDLRLFLSRNKTQYCTIEEKLQGSYRRKNVELVVHGILRRNLEVLNELKKASESVLKNVDTLRNKLEMREEPKTIFTAKEVRDGLQHRYGSLKRKYEETKSKYYSLMFKRVSSAKALSRAKNIFVQGGFKKLSIEQKAYEKALARYEWEKLGHQKRVMDFNNRQWTSSGEKLREQYYIAKEKIHLEETARTLAETKSRLEKEIVRLETLCQTVEAQEKIALIAVGILRKNLKIAQEYESAKKLVKD
ncbi:MAG: MobA/MobL family protein [Bacteroidales bacterium]|nr:MobA/MobL family protein [Bacteroidales bacterium]